jgi:hypothetical protein
MGRKPKPPPPIDVPPARQGETQARYDAGAGAAGAQQAGSAGVGANAARASEDLLSGGGALSSLFQEAINRRRGGRV